MGQAISSTQFFLYGKRHFTQTGYLKHVSKYYTTPVQPAAAIPVAHAQADGVNMSNKVVVVTGANSGLGKEVATYAAAKGARVYMLCRSKDRAQQAKDEMVTQIQSYSDNETKDDQKNNYFEPTIEIIQVDVGELAQVRDAVQQLQAKETQIDALVCNAGVLLNDKQTTLENFECTFASHLLGGTYVLSRLLIPQLQAAAETGGGRAIFVTSGGMYNFKVPSWEIMTSTDPAVEYNGVNVYAYVKRAQVLLAERWAVEVPDVTWCTVHPGWSDTPAVDEAFGDMKKYLMPLREPWQGAEGVAWLTAAPKTELESGALYLDRQVQTKHLAGPFFTEGKFTKNTQQEVDALMENLKQAAGL